MRKLESKVQKKLIEALLELDWAVLRLHPSELRIPGKKSTMTNGLPDLVAFRKGHIAFIEVKRRNETYKPLQYVFAKLLRGFGVISIVYREGDDIVELLSS